MGTGRRHELTDDADRLRRLRLVWLRDLVTAAEQLAGQPTTGTPAERLALSLSAEIDRWMVRRGTTHRTLGASRRTLARALKGDDVLLSSVADIANILDCDVTIAFRPRGGDTDVTNGARDGANPCAIGSPERTVDPDASTTARTPADTPLDHED
jgi:hypothetical protein